MNRGTKHYGEIKFGGFTRIDGTVAFYSRVVSLLKKEFIVLDYGCGRGKSHEDPNPYRRNLRTLKGRVEKVIGIDIDPMATENPFLDEFILVNNRTKIPLEDNSIDLCVADWVVEHLEEPSIFFNEVNRVLKIGGYLCIRTSNNWSYVGIMTKIIPNRFHASVLSKVQKGREEEDVYPTFSRCNTLKQLKKELGESGFSYAVYGHEAEPSYLDFSRIAYAVGTVYGRIVPSWMFTSIFAFACLEEES